MKRQITVKIITVRDLLKFADTAARPVHDNAVAPISRIRALAHTKNPCASADDAALLVAFHKNRCIGYYGVFRGNLFHDGSFSKVYWSSTFYVAAPYRGQGVGQKLVQNIIALDQDVLVCGVSPKAKDLLRICGYRETLAETHWQMRLDRINNVLPKPNISNGLPPFRQIHAETRLKEEREYQHCQDQKRYFYQKVYANLEKPSRNIRSQETGLVGDVSFPEKQDRPCFYRGADVINWMLKYKWMYSRDEINDTVPDEEVTAYYFTTVKDIHKYFSFEFRSDSLNLSPGLLVFSVSRRRGTTTLKILDHAFACRETAWSACRLILHYAQEFLADRIDIPIDLVPYYASQELLAPLLKRKVRTIFYHPKKESSVLEKHIDRITFAYCDGDVPFI